MVNGYLSWLWNFGMKFYNNIFETWCIMGTFDKVWNEYRMNMGYPKALLR